ncbi:MAG: hypothetical protein WCF57_09715 [Pyrinomonadaceae bacterium]
MLEQAVSMVGALLVLAGFAAQRFKLISSDSASYLLLNLFGGFILFLIAIDSRQLGFIVMEGAWTLISLAGLWRLWRSKRINLNFGD